MTPAFFMALDDASESSRFFNKAFSVGEDGFRLFPEVT
jgi:hypothetical protein